MSASLNLEHAPSLIKGDVVEVKTTNREKSWFQARLERGKRERFSEVVTVTPGLAQLMLGQNIGNRPMRQTRIKAHVDRLQRGDFILTHQGIAFDTRGVLNDGQHRLSAIVQSAVPGVLQVTFGANREEFEVVDQGDKRTASDVLSIKGETQYAIRASVAKMLLVIKTRATTVDQQLVADYAVEIRGPEMDAALRFGMTMKSVCAPTPAAVAWWCIRQKTKHRDRMDKFFDGLSSGEGLTGVRLRLREWLRKRELTSLGAGSYNAQRAAAIINAWNSFVSGKKTFAPTWQHSVKLPEVL